MNLLPDELKPQSIKCENCKQYISSDLKVCKFCSNEVSDDYKQSALDNEKQEKKSIALNSHKNTIILGCVFLAIGVTTIFQPIISLNYGGNANFSCLTPIGLIGGIVILLKGLIRYFKEKNN